MKLPCGAVDSSCGVSCTRRLEGVSECIGVSPHPLTITACPYSSAASGSMDTKKGMSKWLSCGSCYVCLNRAASVS